jgi:hypothetical protein
VLLIEVFELMRDRHSPALTTSESADVTLGGSIHDAATVLSGRSASGFITRT